MELQEGRKLNLLNKIKNKKKEIDWNLPLGEIDDCIEKYIKIC